MGSSAPTRSQSAGRFRFDDQEENQALRTESAERALPPPRRDCTSAHDDGAFKHLYRDYESDEPSKLKETEIVRGCSRSGAVFEDPDFPCDGASLYRNQFRRPRARSRPRWSTGTG